MKPMTWQDRARYRQELLAEFELAVDNELAKRHHEASDGDVMFEEEDDEFFIPCCAPDGPAFPCDECVKEIA
jgi:hypothetical protein